MKRIILVFVALMPLLLAAQPRENGKGPLKIEKSSQVINEPAGWIYEEGINKWCGYYGVLLPEFKNNDKKPIQAPMSKKANVGGIRTNQQREILSMQMKRTTLDTTTIYLLYISNWYVEFDYPYLQKGPHYYKQFSVYMLSDSIYNSLWDLDTGITKVPVINVFGYYKGIDEKRMLTIMNDTKYLKPVCYAVSGSKISDYYWYIKKEDENTIRFVAPYDHIGCCGGKHDFSHEYFEVSLDTFYKLKIQ